jgi:Protein of unknown function (DUF2971)
MILYHYTTAEGRQGIIKSKSIWASDYRFLNDPTEFNYGFSIFEEILAEIAKELPSEAVDIIKNFRKTKPDVSLLIASFCQEGDLLSQWRGYNGAIGYAIGFDGDWLTQNAAAQEFQLVPAVYESDATQKQIIIDKFSLLKSLLESPGQRTFWENVKIWWAQILTSIATLKDEHFKEEREYRLVRVTDGWLPEICTRATRSGLVPYLPVKLDFDIKHPRLHPRNIGIERIIVGPGLSDQQKAAVDALLASQHMRLEIGKSGIPYIPNG